MSCFFCCCDDIINLKYQIKSSPLFAEIYERKAHFFVDLHCLQSCQKFNGWYQIVKWRKIWPLHARSLFFNIICCPKYVNTFYTIYAIQTVAALKTNFLVWTIIVLIRYRIRTLALRRKISIWMYHFKNVIFTYISKYQITGAYTSDKMGQIWANSGQIWPKLAQKSQMR